MPLSEPKFSQDLLLPNYAVLPYGTKVPAQARRRIDPRGMPFLFRFSPLAGGRAFARAAVKLFNDGIDQRQLLIGGTGKAFYPGQKKIRMYAGNLVFQRMPTLRSRRIMDNQFYRSSSQKQAPPMRIKQTKRQRPYPLWFCGASIAALTQAYACEAAERRRAPAPASAASSAYKNRGDE